MPKRAGKGLSIELSQIHVSHVGKYQVTLDASHPGVPEVNAFFVIRYVNGPAETTTMEQARSVAERYVHQFARGLLEKLESGGA